jgi:hypothetical protein
MRQHLYVVPMVAVALWWEWRDEEEEEAAINQRQGREEVKKTERLLDRGRGRGGNCQGMPRRVEGRLLKTPRTRTYIFILWSATLSPLYLILPYSSIFYIIIYPLYPL